MNKKEREFAGRFHTVSTKQEYASLCADITGYMYDQGIKLSESDEFLKRIVPLNKEHADVRAKLRSLRSDSLYEKACIERDKKRK